MANDNVIELTGKSFDEFVKKGIVFVDFYAEWCMPCLMMAPVVDELAEKLKGKIKFGKINISDNESIAQKFRISSIPNFIMFKDGKAVEQFIGAMSSEELENKLKKFI